MADVFISYHMKSAGEVAQRIGAALEADGISCWYAGRDMKLGAFAGVIVEEIEACKVFLLILDEQSFHSAHVANEIALAFDRYAHDKPQIEIIPFLIDPAIQRKGNDRISKTIRYYAIQFSYMDGVPPDEAHIRALAEKIRMFLSLSAENERT